MSGPISIRLDEDVRAELESQAREKGIGLATLLRDIAKQAAFESLRARIYAESERVGHVAASNPQAAQFYLDCGTPDAGLLTDDPAAFFDLHLGR
jgi:hypothetical protein